MKAALKDWLAVGLVLLALAGGVAWQLWQAYRRYQVEQAIINLSNSTK